jgi:hypothetical protein
VTVMCPSEWGIQRTAAALSGRPRTANCRLPGKLTTRAMTRARCLADGDGEPVQRPVRSGQDLEVAGGIAGR